MKSYNSNLSISVISVAIFLCIYGFLLLKLQVQLQHKVVGNIVMFHIKKSW